MSNIDKIYLELSENEGVTHKFYEISIDGCHMTIRYGRIGNQGQSSTKTLATAEKATAEAQKKIKAKKSKGYAEAVQGVKKARAITRRTITSHQSTSKVAPTLWHFKSDADAFGIFVDQQYCWIGNEKGNIYKLNHQGEVQRQFRLKDGVKAIVSDGHWLYAGCDDGNVYDLTGKMPYVAYEIKEGVDIYWIDIFDGMLGVSDADGNLLISNYEDESISTNKSKGNAGWMVRCDENFVYHAHSRGVSVYDSLGNASIWHCKTDGAVLFGWQEKDMLYAGTANKKVHEISKKGKIIQTFTCDNPVFSCATSKEGDYVFAGDNYSSIYCFNKIGERLWKLSTGCGSAYSMQYLDKRLYIVTTDGSMTCIDASQVAIEQAEAGQYPVAKSIKAPKSITASITTTTTIEITTNTTEGVILECYKSGSKLRMRVISENFHTDWRVQFSKNLREEGAFYIVEEIKESQQGGFYRTYGNIRKLIDYKPTT